MICLYVDDLIYIGNGRAMLEFDMFDLIMMHYFLGVEIVQSAIGIFLCLSKEICARNLRQVWDEEL